MPKYETIELPMGQTVIVRNNDDGSVTSFFPDPANSDYQAYLATLVTESAPTASAPSTES